MEEIFSESVRFGPKARDLWQHVTARGSIISEEKMREVLFHARDIWSTGKAEARPISAPNVSG
jgi:hypothetical protein